MSAIFAAINFNYVAARGYTVYNTSGFPITVCLLRMSFDSYRLSNDQRRYRLGTSVMIRLGDPSLMYHAALHADTWTCYKGETILFFGT